MKMRLFELILQNVSPQRIARDFAEAIADANSEDLVTVTIKHFLHSIMDAIGFNYYVTVNEISNGQFDWPEEDAITYRFHYEHDIFQRFQHFLEETCKIMDNENLMEPLITLMETFLTFSESLDEPWEENFREPLSLICYPLLQSMNKIRKHLTNPNMILDNICHKLFENSQKGLGFPDSHQTIFKGICTLLASDYNYFSYFDENIFKFYSNCMEYEISKSSGPLFVYMQNALENSNAPNNERIKLVNYLTDSNMIKAYCVFAQKNTKKQVQSLLNYLNSLLNHLPVLECISRVQVHIIFSNVYHESQTIRCLAVKFYLTYMRKGYTNKFILRDILDFILIQANGIETLDLLIKSLWDEFPYMTELDPYLKILQKNNWGLNMLSVAAQIAYRVYKRLYDECDSSDEYSLRLSKFLMKLPSLLMLLKEKWQIKGILSNIYSITDPEKARFTFRDFPIAADRYTRYAMRSLMKYGEEPLVVQNTVHNMLKLMDYFNMQEEMEQFADDIYLKYKQFVSNIDELTEGQIMNFQNTLCMLSILTDTSSALSEDNLVELLSDLGTLLIDSNKLRELSVTFNCFLDSYAIATYSGCLNILSIICKQMTTDEENIESKVLFDQVKSFLKYLLECLENSNASNVSIFYIEKVLRALFEIYIVFNFKLDRHVYHIFVNSVNLYVFKAPMSTDRLRQLELQRNILHSFNLMHKIVEIPVPITWKIAIHFGVFPQFEEELIELLDVLFEYNSYKFKTPSLFTYIIPVAIYNMYQRRVSLPKFTKALRAHKSYVEAKVTDVVDQRVMKIHIVLTMVDMIERAIQIGEINKQPNRMELLSNMNILLTDLYQNQSDLVLSQSRRLEQHALTPDEISTLTSFQDQLT